MLHFNQKNKITNNKSLFLCSIFSVLLVKFTNVKNFCQEQNTRKYFILPCVFFFYFTSNQHFKGCMVTFQLYWQMKTSGTPPCIISGTRIEPQTFCYLVGQLPHMKESKVSDGIQTHSGGQRDSKSTTWPWMPLTHLDRTLMYYQ